MHKHHRSLQITRFHCLKVINLPMINPLNHPKSNLKRPHSTKHQKPQKGFLVPISNTRACKITMMISSYHTNFTPTTVRNPQRNNHLANLAKLTPYFRFIQVPIFPWSPRVLITGQYIVYQRSKV